METGRQQFCDLGEPAKSVFERIFRSALESLGPDLAAAPWYVREREVVNLFVMGHLIPKFEEEHLDIKQIGIEVPVQILPSKPGEKPGVYADIVVWPHSKATVWQTCKPLARIEWKNISCREKTTGNLERQHQDDARRLQLNSTMASLNYAVMTVRQNGQVELRCIRIEDGERSDLLLPPLKCQASGDESLITGIGYKQALSRPQSCKICIGMSGAL